MGEYKLNIADIDDIAYRTGLPYEEVSAVLRTFLRKLDRRGYVIVPWEEVEKLMERAENAFRRAENEGIRH